MTGGERSFFSFHFFMLCFYFWRFCDLVVWPNTRCLLPRRWLISQCHLSLRRGEERKRGGPAVCFKKLVLSRQVRISEI